MDTLPHDHRRALLAFYDAGDHAEAALREIIERDFPLDRISLLGKASASGDDPLGVYHAVIGYALTAIVPWLAYASWHAYRDTLVPNRQHLSAVGP
ncbi:MAG: hypothetical protein WCA32_05235 [Chromatiaceae bacterium]